MANRRDIEEFSGLLDALAERRPLTDREISAVGVSIVLSIWLIHNCPQVAELAQADIIRMMDEERREALH